MRSTLVSMQRGQLSGTALVFFLHPFSFGDVLNHDHVAPGFSPGFQSGDTVIFTQRIAPSFRR